jgi:hypothetical protein
MLFENRVLRKKFGPEVGDDCLMRNIIAYTLLDVVVVVYFMLLNIVYRRKTQTSNRVTQYGAEIPDSYTLRQV